MNWYQDSAHRRLVIIGFTTGLIFPLLGSLLQINLNNLPINFASMAEVQFSTPLLWIIDTAPFVLGFMAWTIGRQRKLVSIIERGKKEMEATFDSFSDLIFVATMGGVIVRCNHAVIDRLNTQFYKVIGNRSQKSFRPMDRAI